MTKNQKIKAYKRKMKAIYAGIGNNFGNLVSPVYSNAQAYLKPRERKMSDKQREYLRVIGEL